MKNAKKLWFFIPVLLIIIGVSVAVILMNRNRTAENGKENQNETTDENANDPSGTIYVEAGDGTLLNGDSYSYIAESARGLEAYLGDKGASAVYEFTAESAKDYELWVKLSDDGIHDNGARSVTIVINNNQTRKYAHVSENTITDTSVWKWYKIGTVTLAEGSNKISFTKDENTTAAYVMDEFKFTPVEK